MPFKDNLPQKSNFACRPVTGGDDEAQKIAKGCLIGGHCSVLAGGLLLGGNAATNWGTPKSRGGLVTSDFGYSPPPSSSSHPGTPFTPGICKTIPHPNDAVYYNSKNLNKQAQCQWFRRITFEKAAIFFRSYSSMQIFFFTHCHCHWGVSTKKAQVFFITL